MITLRIRSVMWFATGMLLAVALVWTSVAWRAYALPGPSESTSVMVDPERILDTRDPVNLGLDGPFVSPVSQKLQVTGLVPTATGPKIVVPAGATGVLLNVTAVGTTANGFISVRPGDAAGAPSTSSLNITAGVTVPNAVQVALPTSGANAGMIDITFDALGVAGPTTDILIDVVGYTTSEGLQDLVASQPIARSAREGDVGTLPDNDGSIVLTVTIDVPVAGLLQIVGSSLIDIPVTAGEYRCWLSEGAGSVPEDGALADTNRDVDLLAGVENSFCSTNGGLAVAAGNHVINLVLAAPAAAASVFDDATLDVLFIAGGSITATGTESGSGDSDD